MVKIRLKRMGMRHRPTYRIVVTDSQRSRDGKYIESLGHYDPRTKKLLVNLERADYWKSVGAQSTETAGKLIKRFSREQQAAPIDIPPVEDETVAIDTAAAAIIDNKETQTPPEVTEEVPVETPAAEPSAPEETGPATDTTAEPTAEGEKDEGVD